MTSPAPQPLVVLDTPTLYYRAYHALPDTIRDASGTPVHAVRGVLDTLAALVGEVGSTRFIAAMDAEWRPAFRTAVVPEYKAQRVVDEAAGTEMPDDLAVQIPVLRALLDAAGIPVAEVPETEADDVIASIAATASDPVIVVSSDRDLLSLLAPGRALTVMRPRSGGAWESLGLDDLPGAYGVPDGSTYRALAALRGDPSDGLAGAPGIGEKTAAKLLAGYGDLDAVFAAAGSGAKEHGLSDRRRASLLESEDAVRRNVVVMTCLEDLDVAEAIAAADDAPDAEAVAALARDANLTRSASRLVDALSGAASPSGAPSPTGPVSGTSGASAVSDAPAASGLPESPASWTDAGLWAFDLETTGVDPHAARIVSAALVEFVDGSPARRTEWLIDPGTEIPRAAVEVHGISNERVRAEGSESAAGVGQILEEIAAIRDGGGVLIGHNVVYDLTVLQQEAVRHGLRPDAVASTPAVVDTLVIDKRAERYRRGSRVLGALCDRWGVVLEDAHDAAADAIAAGQVALAIAAAHPEIAHLSPAAVHAAQIAWKREQAASLQEYLRSRRRADAVVNGDWPFER